MVVVGLVGAVTLILVVYISNILSVRSLLDRNTNLTDSLATQKIRTDHLLTETNLLESVERIQAMAQKEFKMATPARPPMIIQVPAEEIKLMRGGTP